MDSNQMCMEHACLAYVWAKVRDLRSASLFFIWNSGTCLGSVSVSQRDREELVTPKFILWNLLIIFFKHSLQPPLHTCTLVLPPLRLPQPCPSHIPE